MESVLVDGEWLAMGLPKGFCSLAHEDLESLMGISYDCLWGMRDEQRHMLISITWKDSNKLLTRLANEKDLAQRVDTSYAKRYRKGGYRREARFERAVSGASAHAQGFRFSYTVEGVAQEGEVLVFKRGIRCYTLCYYTRSAVADENRRVYEGIIGSLEVR